MAHCTCVALLTPCSPYRRARPPSAAVPSCLSCHHPAQTSPWCRRRSELVAGTHLPSTPSYHPPPLTPRPPTGARPGHLPVPTSLLLLPGTPFLHQRWPPLASRHIQVPALLTDVLPRPGATSSQLPVYTSRAPVSSRLSTQGGGYLCPQPSTHRVPASRTRVPVTAAPPAEHTQRPNPRKRRGPGRPLVDRLR